MDPRQRLALMAARLDSDSAPGSRKKAKASATARGVPSATIRRRKLGANNGGKTKKKNGKITGQNKKNGAENEDENAPCDPKSAIARAAEAAEAAEAEAARLNLAPRLAAAAALPAPSSDGAPTDWATRAVAFGTNVHHELGMPYFNSSMTAKPKPVVPLDYGNPVHVECSATATFLVLDNGRLLASGEGALGIKVPKPGAVYDGSDGQPPQVGTVETFRPPAGVGVAGKPLVRSTAHNIVQFPSKSLSHCPRVLQIACGWGNHCAAIVQQVDVDPSKAAASSRPSTSSGGAADGAVGGGRDGPGGQLWTWGMGDRGQLGHGPSVAFAATPRRLTSLATADAVDADAADVCVRVACGELHTVVVMRGGAVFAFGHGAAGQLGLPHVETMDASVDGGPAEVAAAAAEAAAAAAAGQVPEHQQRPVSQSRGRIGIVGGKKGGAGGRDRLRQCAAVPVRVPLYAGEYRSAALRAVDVACGLNHTAVLTSGGTVHTCGWGEDGRLGHGDEDRRLELTQVAIRGGGDSGITPRGIEIAAVACGGAFCLVLDYDGRVFSWGSNTFGQLGRRTPTPKGTPASIDEITGVVTPAKPAGKPLNWRPGLVRGLADDDGQRVETIACGFAHCLALVLRENRGRGRGGSSGNSRALLVWGWGEEGQLGLGTETNCANPTELRLVKNKQQTSSSSSQGSSSSSGGGGGRGNATVIAPLQFAAGRSHSVVLIGRRTADVADDEDGDALLRGLQTKAMEETKAAVVEAEMARVKAEEVAEAARKKVEEEVEAERQEEERQERELMEEAVRRTEEARKAREEAEAKAAVKLRLEMAAKVEAATRKQREELLKREEEAEKLAAHIAFEAEAARRLEERVKAAMKKRQEKLAQAEAEAKRRAEAAAKAEAERRAAEEAEKRRVAEEEEAAAKQKAEEEEEARLAQEALDKKRAEEAAQKVKLEKKKKREKDKLILATQERARREKEKEERARKAAREAAEAKRKALLQAKKKKAAAAKSRAENEARKKAAAEKAARDLEAKEQAAKLAAAKKAKAAALKAQRLKEQLEQQRLAKQEEAAARKKEKHDARMNHLRVAWTAAREARRQQLWQIDQKRQGDLRAFLSAALEERFDVDFS